MHLESTDSVWDFAVSKESLGARSKNVDLKLKAETC